MPTILIVDDQNLNRAALSRLLLRQGFRVIEAEDADEALDVARDQLPDLALVDLFMPGTDGFEFAHRVRSEGGPISRMPIQFISALHVPEEALTLARSCGVSRILRRSSTPSEILEAVYEGLGTPVDCDGVPQWGEFALEILRLHIHTISNQLRTVIPALATIIHAEAGARHEPTPTGQAGPPGSR